MTPNFFRTEQLKIIAVLAVLTLIMMPGIMRYVERQRIFSVVASVSSMKISPIQPDGGRPLLPAKGPWPGSVFGQDRSGYIVLSGAPGRSMKEIDLAMDGVPDAASGVVRYHDDGTGAGRLFFVLSSD